ncbi:hypothetical protein, partial [Heyndrickxia coagulans]|uniref:hypothetical protein n=1 Tax=Heyndrickxia coagulans TaxID=1398 RepID=UPI00214DCE97
FSNCLLSQASTMTTNESDTHVSGSNASSNERRDPGWKHARLLDGKDVTKIVCIYCDKIMRGDIYRHKQHLVGGYRNAAKCKKCPEHVRVELEQYISDKKKFEGSNEDEK